jgi:hypothetical protein
LGEVLLEGAHKNADYLFRTDKIVAELKSLEEDPRDEHVQKLLDLTRGWSRRGLMRVYGTAQVKLRELPLEAQREWLKLLESPVEAIIRKANRQIRSTKKIEKLSDGKGLLLILNDGNLLHTEPVNFMTLLARVPQKRHKNGDRKLSATTSCLAAISRMRRRN